MIPRILQHQYRCYRSVLIAMVFSLLSVTDVFADVEADWIARSTHPDVVRAIRFDTESEYSSNLHENTPRDNAYDTAIKVSGAGSIRFDILSNSDAGSGGSWKINFSDDWQTQFGDNSSFYVQWRQRFDQYFIDHPYAAISNASTDWKQVIIGQGDGVSGQPDGFFVNSCTELELVMRRHSAGEYPLMYHSCGWYKGLYESDGASDFLYQNQLTDCFHYGTKDGCAKYYANEWMTFQVGVHLGPWSSSALDSNSGQYMAGFANSTVEFWVAREGQPSVLAHRQTGLVLRRGNYADNWASSAYDARYGLVWLTPFMTDKDPSETHSNASTWYDEVIISRSRIADPLVGSSGPTISFNATPSTVTSGGTSTLTWTATDATSCVASGDWSGDKGTSGSESVGALTVTSTYTLSCVDTNGDSASRIVTVNVEAPPIPTVDLTATPSLVANGGTIELSWTSMDASSCTASGAWSGGKATSGSEIVGTLADNSTLTFNLDCTGVGGSGSDSTVVTTVADPTVFRLPLQTFASYALGTDADNFLDTGMENSLFEDDSLFKIYNVDGNMVFGTAQTATTNIHSHYTGLGSTAWSNYRFNGRMRISGSGDSIGVTLFSDYPNSDSYYRLRRTEGTAFHIAPHGTGIDCVGDTDTGVTPEVGRWYRFQLEAEDTGSQTEVRAKVWLDGTTEPVGWQASCVDSDTRRTLGTVGVWSVVYGSDTGNKYWDDLEVIPLSAPSPPPGLIAN